MLKTNLLSGVFAAPPHNLLDTELLIALQPLSPENGKSKTDTRNATPRAEEVALLLRPLHGCLWAGVARVAVLAVVEGFGSVFARREVRGKEFDLGGAGRVVRDDSLNHALGLVLEEFSPERVLV